MEFVERGRRVFQGPRQVGRELPRVGGSARRQPGKRGARALGHRAQELQRAVLLGDHGDLLALQHLRDRIDVMLGQAAHQVHARRALHQAGEHLVGAGAIDQPDGGEIEHHDAVAGGCRVELGFDAVAHGTAGRAGDEVVIGQAGPRQDTANVDLGGHCLVCASAGMTSCTCAPGNGASPSVSGASSSHSGTMAMRAVPLLMLILPCQRPR